MAELPCSPALLRVLFDPLSYLHPRRLSLPVSLTGQPAARAAANELLLAAYQLRNDCTDAELDALARQLLRYWRRLPQAAYLIGCYARRSELAWRGAMLSLPQWARVFITIDLPTDAATKQQPLCHNELLRIGYAQLRCWRKRLPVPLAQRFPLLFPPHVDAAPTEPDADPMILTLALQYAQRHPHTPPTTHR
ncbi:invasion protein OrgA [Burkholderia sp. HI2714]|uniref:type III secretion apparatus protein OrgA/MxiK n=1 Tax=Burkholderia sp. HI2714 TaxID=2015359 RepID=UPI000B79B418|nr:type III secretion apparatus protein OrgA/MxiK [Burkholderia sp. HI2714]OXJ21506.1 invasion protein OrgA [Burkholderia sp. HI2714]